MSQSNREESFELDLLPVISMMSVCICFLLLTAVWTQIGSVEIKQGLGQESNREDVKASSLWVTMKDRGELKLQVMDSPKTPEQLKMHLKSKTFQLASAQDMSALTKFVSQLKSLDPELKTALILAERSVNYGSVIKMMDSLKIQGIGEIGLAPL